MKCYYVLFTLFSFPKLVIAIYNIIPCAKLRIDIMADFHNSLKDVPIFHKTYALYKTFYGYLPSLPKKDRYTFGERCEIVLLDILEAVVLASNMPKSEKLPVLKQGSLKVDLLKVLFKLGQDLHIFENKQYSILEAQLDEIGKMFGGWIKTTSS